MNKAPQRFQIEIIYRDEDGYYHIMLMEDCLMGIARDMAINQYHVPEEGIVFMSRVPVAN